MGMLHHPQLSHSRTKSHIPGAPPPQGEAAEPKGRESLSQDKVPRCTSAPRLHGPENSTGESEKRAGAAPDGATQGENGTSPNPWLQFTLGVEENHKTDKPSGEPDPVSGDCHFTTATKCPESRGYVSSAIPESFSDQQAADRAEPPTRPRICLLSLLFP